MKRATPLGCTERSAQFVGDGKGLSIVCFGADRVAVGLVRSAEIEQDEVTPLPVGTFLGEAKALVEGCDRRIQPAGRDVRLALHASSQSEQVSLRAAPKAWRLGEAAPLIDVLKGPIQVTGHPIHVGEDDVGAGAPRGPLIGKDGDRFLEKVDGLTESGGPGGVRVLRAAQLENVTLIEEGPAENLTLAHGRRGRLGKLPRLPVIIPRGAEVINLLQDGA